MKFIGMHGKVLEWILFYLKVRLQIVNIAIVSEGVVKEYHSNNRYILRGVSILYLIYV